MRLTRFLAATAAIVTLSAAAPAIAQSDFVQRAAVPEADELAGQMRSLAANPLDVNALIRAGELTLDMGDATAAAGFFARAERIDPRNGRIKAGLGGLLVLSERPGEALRRFAEAEALGRDPRFYAAQRGLAYDLVGQQERAQRDYRLALRTAPDDETVRRYALSLGISGLREQALEQIDTLLRRSDRGAWRTRAFILAMTGDTAGASRIAASMMPAGMGQGLDPFFERLPQLSAADRAFAVHFGEVRATPQRLADARMTPNFAPLTPEPGRQVILASAVVAAPLDAKAQRRAAKRNKRERGNVQLAAANPPAVPLPQPPTYVAGADTAPVTTLPPVAIAAISPPVDRRLAEVREARSPVQSLDSVSVPVTTVPVPRPSQPIVLADRGATSIFAKPADRVASTNITAVPPEADNRVLPEPTARVPMTDARPIERAADTKPIVVEPAQPEREVTPVQVAAVPTPAPPTSGAQRPPISEDSVLARIVASIVIPGSELEPSRAATVPVAVASPGTAVPSLVDKKLAAAKAAADKKALADKKLATEEKATDKKAADIAKADPARIWVQVAGGANEGSLPKEWAKVRDKAPAAFKGKSGWTTPLRATNRVLAGPFKSSDEARTFVNLIAKSGVSGFMFTSEAGQKIAKLPPK